MSMRVYYDSADINKIVAVYEPDADHDTHWVTGEGMTKIVDPSGSFTAGVDHRHHKIVGTTITEMEAGEKTARPLPVVDKTQANPWKTTVRAATAAALAANTRSGNEFTADANGAFADVDGVTLALQDRFLDKDHATGANRGVMLLTQLGDVSNPAKWQRCCDCECDNTLQSGARIFIEEGTVNGGKFATLTTANPITVNTTALTFTIATDVPIVLQEVQTQTGAVATGTTQIPYDDSIPTNTEGDEYMTRAITPLSATSTLKIDVICHLSTNCEDPIHLVAALFKDAVAAAIAAGAETPTLDEVGCMACVSYSFEVASGSTDARTYKVRAGGSMEGTTTFNGQEGSRRLGGVLASSITVTEIEK